MSVVWFVLALIVMAPLVWGLAGSPMVPAVADLGGAELGRLLVPSAVGQGLLVVGLLVGLVLGGGRARVATTHLSTVAHEFGHGLTAALLGGRIDRIGLHRDGSGVAHTSLPGGRPVRGFAVSAAGYVAPGILALASIRVAAAGLGGAWLAYLVGVLAVMVLLAVRSWWGLLLTVGLAAVGWTVLALAPAEAVGVVVAVLAGALAGGGVVDAISQWRGRRGGQDSDARNMARQTGLPVGLFAGMHVLAAGVLAAATSAVLLLPLV
jgi:hypothetical protein